MSRYLSLLLLSLAFSLTAAAAEHRVRVTDPQGLPLPGVSVQVTTEENSAQYVTDQEGQVVIPDATSGTLSASLEGFRSPAPRPLDQSGTTTLVLELDTVSEVVEVSAARSRVPLSEMSSSVTVIERAELDRHLRTSANLADALGKMVPGLAPGNGTVSIYGQTIRGRAMQVLIDGVPLTTLRNGARDLASLDPSIIERVEVLRGTTALYGDGATGGMVNIVTSAPQAGAPRMSTEVTLTSSPFDVGDSAGGRLAQSITGGLGAFDYRVDLATERTGAAFDAEGDRIPADPYGQGGVAESESLSLFGKFGWNITPTQRLTVSANAFDSEQDTDWTSDPAVNSLPAGTVKSRAMRGLDLDHPQGSENQLYQLAYEDRALLGSTLRTHLYSRDYSTVFTPYDGRSLAIYGNKIFQSRIESEALGLRTDVQTPLPVPGLTLYWGADAGSEKTQQPVWIMDPAVYDASGGRSFRSIEDRPWVPLVDKQNYAGFAQLEWMMNQNWLFRGGLRHENVAADIPDFRTLAEITINGGRREFSDTLFNAGVVRYINTHSRAWVSYNEGFSLPDIGLVLRSAPAGASLDSLPFAPQIVEAWEIGLDSKAGAFDWSLAAFYSASELGTSTAGFNQPVVRAPERVHGLEGSLEYRPEGVWAAGLNASWTEGKSDPNRDGVYTWLNNYRIAAPNATLWLEHETTTRWTNRVGVHWSGDRDRFGASRAFGELPIESYAVVDLLSSIRFSSGDLILGVQNLTNEEYYVRDAQLLRSGRNDSHSLAPGTTLRLGWTVRY